MSRQEDVSPRSRPRRGPQPTTSGTAPRLHERAADILSARIAAGAIAPGAVLLESRIAAEFGISRAPARHALATLEAAGLLRRADGRGFLVRGAPRGKPAPARTAAAAISEPIRLASSASWERIYKEVEIEIVARTSFGAWRIVESELARYHGVSRTVAREVLARLQQCGVVKKDERSHWYAPGLTRGYLAELYEMRRILEPAALRAAAPLLPADQVRRLRRNLEEASARASTLDGAALDRLEAEMHVALLAPCPNRTLLEALRVYQSLLVAHSFLYRWGPRLYESEPFLPEHLAIAERLEAGHVAEAARAMEAHMRASLDRAAARIDVVARGPMPPALPYLEPYARA